MQTLQFTVKEPTVGKAATFLKVDHVIKETKNLMNVINKVVTTCFDCANKVSIFFLKDIVTTTVVGKINEYQSVEYIGVWYDGNRLMPLILWQSIFACMKN